MSFRLRGVALAVGLAFHLPLLAQEASKDKTTLDAVTVEAARDRFGTGFILEEDAPKMRSSLSREGIDKQRATANPFQLLDILPGVNAFSHDATGMYGGGLAVRGFNSDQIGLTIDGAPVNDSGNFAVYPQEYVDQENIEDIYLTQGMVDADAPHVGATGGNIGILSAQPLKRERVRLVQTVGADQLWKTFARYDTGLRNERFRAFASYSRSEADKWRGLGGAKRDHVDAKALLSLSSGSSISLGVLYNEAVNNNYKSLSRAQFDAFGRDFDFFPTWAGHPTPVNGTAQTESFSNTSGAATPTALNNAYYGFSLNPFRNALVTSKGSFKVSDRVKLEFEPYYWYGYGTGGTQQTTLRESGFLNGGRADINGDGDTLDTVIVYRGSLTETHRPGATMRLNWQLGGHQLLFGLWGERARHRQTAPATRIGDSGSIADLWLASNLILRPDGTPYQNRDWRTISTASEFFAQDTLSFLEDRLALTLGLRLPRIERDFTNYANEGFNQAGDYHLEKSYSSTLPSLGLRYRLNPQSHLFFSSAKTFKAPGNFSYGNALSSGVVRLDESLRAERAVNYEAGYRFQGEWLNFSGALYYTDYRDRLASAYDPINNTTTQTNVGPVRLSGLELEAGAKFGGGFSGYLSLTHADSRIRDDLRTGVSSWQPTAGKAFPNTPRFMGGLTLQYDPGRYYVALKIKHTAKVYSTMTNDESIDGYTVADLNAGYRLESGVLFKNAVLRLNLSNLFDKTYLSLNAGSGSAITTNATGTGASSPQYYVGAPRFVSLSFTADF
ncbi:MAG: TonB-dependent receptor [Betaproteobacteria bacterium]|nr:TonB-dependent receptor [Betaproteobacteria bacterium]